MLQTVLITLHNISRWLVLVFGILAAARAFSGWRGKKAWTPADDRAGMLFTSLLDLQLLIGVVLYFTSPFMQPILQNFGQAMGNSSQRFFAVEHVFAMILAIVVAHIGRSLSKKAAGDVARHKRAAIGFTVALVLILAAIPWSRPLLQFFGVFTL